MRAPESPSERYMYKQILFFAYLMCSSVSRANALKNVSAICHIQFQWKVTEDFRNRIKEIWSVRTKIALIVKIFRKKKFDFRRHVFVVCVLIYPLSKFGGNRTNSLWVLAFYSVCFKWKNWFEKTALNKSIRRVIFTSGQNLKLPFLCQYLIFLRTFCRWKFMLRPIH